LLPTRRQVMAKKKKCGRGGGTEPTVAKPAPDRVEPVPTPPAAGAAMVDTVWKDHETVELQAKAAAEAKAVEKAQLEEASLTKAQELESTGNKVNGGDATTDAVGATPVAESEPPGSKLLESAAPLSDAERAAALISAIDAALSDPLVRESCARNDPADSLCACYEGQAIDVAAMAEVCTDIAHLDQQQLQRYIEATEAALQAAQESLRRKQTERATEMATEPATEQATEQGIGPAEATATLSLYDTLKTLTLNLYSTETRPAIAGKLVSKAIEAVHAEEVVSQEVVRYVAALTTYNGLIEKGTELFDAARPYLKKAKDSTGRQELLHDGKRALGFASEKIIEPAKARAIGMLDVRVVQPTKSMAAPYIQKAITTQQVIVSDKRVESALESLKYAKEHPKEVVEYLKLKAIDLIGIGPRFLRAN